MLVIGVRRRSIGGDVIGSLLLPLIMLLDGCHSEHLLERVWNFANTSNLINQRGAKYIAVIAHWITTHAGTVKWNARELNKSLISSTRRSVTQA